MKKPLCLAVWLLFANLVPSAEDKSPKVGTDSWTPHGYVSTTLQQRYMSLPASRDLHDGLMVWNELYASLPGNFFLNIWDTTQMKVHNLPLHGGDETDSTLGWQTDVYRGVKLTLAETWMNFYPKSRIGNGDVMVSRLQVGKEFLLGRHSLKPELWVWWMAHTENYPDGSIVFMSNVTHKWQKPFGIQSLTLRSRHMIAWDDGWAAPVHSSAGVFYRLDCGLDWRLSRRLCLTLPGFITLVPITDAHDGRGQHNSLNTSLKLTF